MRCQMLKLHEHLKEEEDSAKNMVNNSIQHDEIHTTLKFAAGSVFLISGLARKI